MILRCRFLLTLFCSWLGGVYVSFLVCPHFFSASSCSNLVLLNTSALEEFHGILSLIIFVNCFLICGGWFVDISMYINLFFIFLYGRYVLFSKLNVASKKSTSVRLVTISILKLIFLKILIIFFRTLSACCLFILQRINSPSFLYKFCLCWIVQVLDVGEMNLFGISFLTIEVHIIVIFEENSSIPRCF